VVVFLVPKTGTSSLTQLFRRIQKEAEISFCVHAHGTWHNFEKMDGEISPDIMSYRKFAFYREPVDRIISIVNYLRRSRQLAKFYHAFYGDKYPISCSYRGDYTTLSPKMKKMNDAIPLMEAFHKFRWFFERGAYGRLQMEWLDCPGLELLNFHDYHNELGKLLIALNLDPEKVVREKVNQSIYIPELDTLTAEETAELREYAKEDYEFFASKGITFQ
jgi:hypothetical protein